MSEMRYDWLADRWVIFAPSRADRPNEFESEQNSHQEACRSQAVERQPDCPFCRGNESQTPPPSLSLPNEKNWEVRVVDNRFPAVLDGSKSSCSPKNGQQQRDYEAHSQRDASVALKNQTRDLLYHQRKLVGGHEVIIESPDHCLSLTSLSDDHISLVFKAYQERIRNWLTKETIEYVVLFKNVGPRAGASLSHTHSQLIAMDFLPSEVAARNRRVQTYQSERLGCPMCATIEEELSDKKRIVFESENFLAFCPYASPTPFLVYLVPKSHGLRFDEIGDEVRDEFALQAVRILRSLEKTQKDCHYNFVLHTYRPSQDGSNLHWHLELVPRLTMPAGFEWGSDCFINPCYPEQAASILRQCV